MLRIERVAARGAHAPAPSPFWKRDARPSSSRVRHDLRAMTGDGVAFGAMVGLGESYLPAFTLALGYGSVSAGLIATIPMLAGAMLQLVTPAAVGLLNSHRRWVVLCAALQALSFIPLIAGGLAGELDEWNLYVAASLYWGLGMSTGPAWTAWATTLVPARIRPRFLARRAAAGQAALVMGLLAAGLLLEAATDHEETLLFFAGAFALAMAARLVSTVCLISQSEPRPIPLGDSRISAVVVARHLRTGGHGPLLVFLFAFQLSVWIAAPFFTPYMLEQLELGYLDFTILTTSAFAARVLALPWIGNQLPKLGTKRVLSIAIAGITPLPALWLVSDAFWWLLGLQVLGGVAWAAFELATLLSFFERIPAHGQTSVLTVYNLANACAIAVGTLIGAAVLEPIADPVIGFIAVMALSTIVRCAVAPLLRGVQDIESPTRAPVLRTMSARPSSGALQRPVLEPHGRRME